MVVDANVVAAYFLERSRVTQGQRVEWAMDRSWMAPALWRSEFVNVLRKHMKAGSLTLKGAAAIFAEADFEVQSVRQPRAETILRLHEDSGCSTYDCEYVAVAMWYNQPLLTFDKELLEAFPTVARKP